MRILVVVGALWCVACLGQCTQAHHGRLLKESSEPLFLRRFLSLPHEPRYGDRARAAPCLGQAVEFLALVGRKGEHKLGGYDIARSTYRAQNGE